MKRVIGLACRLELAAGGEVVVEVVHVLEPVVVHGEEQMAWGQLVEQISE